MKKTPVSMRPHIGIFGRRNVGKSSLINALTGQQTAIVSELAGTTTDPVGKAMEILPLGPVFILDTAGLDDVGELGEKRVAKSLLSLKRTDLILLVSNYELFGDLEEKLIEERKNILVVFNKVDLIDSANRAIIKERLEKVSIDYIEVSAKTGFHIPELREKIAAKVPEVISSDSIIGHLLQENDTIIHVIPIDSAAPKGRIILPQEQVLRECLDFHTISLCVQTEQLANAIRHLTVKPKLVITDSQAIEKVAEQTPEEILLTTYSIVFSRLKGDLPHFIEGLRVLESLDDGDKILIAEACTHHSQPDDIGRVKIPKWLDDFTGKKLEYIINPGKMIHQDLSEIKLIVQCGGCMINRKEMLSRQETAKELQIPITNYGILISHIHNSLERTIRPFPECHLVYRGLSNNNRS